MDNEVDLAMELAKERQMRIEQTRRLHSLMYEIVPYLANVESMVGSIIGGDPRSARDMSDQIKHTAIWGADIRINLIYNMVRPVGMEPMISDSDIDEYGTLSEAVTSRVESMQELLSKQAELIQDDWEKVAETSSLPSGGQIRRSGINSIKRMVRTSLFSHMNMEPKERSETVN